LDYAVQQGPDAVSALSKWEPEELEEFGVELALRAEKDAKALKALDELTKLDINSSDPAVRAEVNRLIQEIAENSTQGGGERFVLGVWDNKNGIAGGYVNDARLNGGAYYTSHPDVYKKLEAVFGEKDPRIDQTLWQINQAALQKQIEKGADFDYSLASLKDVEKYKAEVGYVKLLVSGNVAEVLDTLSGESLPARLKEVQLLLDAGYTPHYDDAAQVIHWTLEP